MHKDLNFSKLDTHALKSNLFFNSIRVKLNFNCHLNEMSNMTFIFGLAQF